MTSTVGHHSTTAGGGHRLRRRVAVAAAGSLLVLATMITASPPSQAASACWDDVAIDVDGGGPDVVIGLPGYDLPGKPDAGALVVFSDVGVKGEANPRPPARRTVITADDVPGLAAQAGARFGASVVIWRDALDFDDPDRCAEILVGAPGTTVAGQVGAGRVYQLHGSPNGIDRVTRSFDEQGLGTPGGAQSGAGFGSALAADTLSAIAIGVPGRDIGTATDAGRVVMIDYTDVTQPPVTRIIQQGGGGSRGSAETGDRFGEVLQLLPTGDGPVLVIGVPHEDIGRQVDAGALGLVPHAGSLSLVSQDSPGADGTAEAGDRYGASFDTFFTFTTVAVGIIAVGVPGEDLPGATDAGIVSYAQFEAPLTPENPIGPLTATAYSTNQDSPGVPGSVEPGDAFGSAVLIGEFGTDSGQRRLVSTSPNEDLGSIADAGLLGVTPIGEDGRTAARPNGAEWHQDSPGVLGTAERGDRFAASASQFDLTSLEDDDDTVWSVVLLTVPGEDVSGTVDAGLAYLGVPGGVQVQLALPVRQTGAGIGMVAMRLY